MREVPVVWLRLLEGLGVLQQPTVRPYRRRGNACERLCCPYRDSIVGESEDVHRCHGHVQQISQQRRVECGGDIEAHRPTVGITVGVLRRGGRRDDQPPHLVPPGEVEGELGGTTQQWPHG